MRLHSWDYPSHTPFHSAGNSRHEVQQQQPVSVIERRNIEAAVFINEKATVRFRGSQVQQVQRQQQAQRELQLRCKQLLRNAKMANTFNLREEIRNELNLTGEKYGE
jgi:hypothetical protein